LYNNHFNGTIDAVRGLTKLKYLNLAGNQLTGTIGALEQLHSIDFLGLHNNRFHGTLAALTKKMTSLTQLWIHHNGFSGPLVPIYSMPSLLKVIANANMLTGTIAGLSKLKSLAEIRLGGNCFTGPMPPLPFANYTSGCGLEGNNFSCPLPAGADPKCHAECGANCAGEAECPPGQMPDLIVAGGNYGCRCDAYCGTNWNNEIKSKRPEWKGAACHSAYIDNTNPRQAWPCDKNHGWNASLQNDLLCICKEAAYFCSGACSEAACPGRGFPPAVRNCVPAPVIPVAA
jgi:hypothetical protein